MQTGELVCLLGPNGAGKSTVMRTLSGMQPVLDGQVLINGTKLDTMSASDRATRIGIVLTERIDVGYLSGYSLVSLGLYPYTDWSGRMGEADHRAVSEAIDAVSARDLAERPISEMSDGERQKILIARVLAQDTEVILLDEPTAFLDLARRVEIVALLRRLAHESDKAILMSTHDLDNAVRNADRIWLMTGGRVETGIPESLVLNKSFQSAFAGKGIEFDEASGGFRPSHEPVARICFSESGLVATWTTRALQRIGYEVRSEPEAKTISLSLTRDEAKTIWVLDSAGDRQPFDALDKLIGHLKIQLPKVPSDG